MKIMLDPGAFMPVREHATDAGLDIKAKEDGIVRANQSAVFHTGVHIQLPPNCGGVFISKSGLMMYHDITSTGLVDEGYNGEVMVKLFNHGDEDYIVRAGDKISQLVVVPVLYEQLEVVGELCLADGDRGAAGFGSTGR